MYSAKKRWRLLEDVVADKDVRSMSNNRIRIFSELVSLDAWYLPFSAKKQTSSLHADVTFLKARMGAESDAVIRFTLQLKQAELKVIIPETEQISAVRQSVDRAALEIVGTKKHRSSNKQKASMRASLSATVNAMRAKGGGSASAQLHRDAVVSEETSTVEKLRGVSVSHSVDAEGNHRWLLQPGHGAVLTGKPWDAVKKPLMDLRDKRTGDNRTLSPTVRLEVTCRREDLVIEDIVVKDASLLETVQNMVLSSRKYEAVEAFIKNRLEEHGLRSAELSDPYSVIHLGEITAADEE